ncbi:ATP-binding protein [Methylocystis parvus]|uniref:hybrid sensor histidine kinase/response regulator n=1 Tax=Methylocystis parvus TaxID=134 RepID=UPI003C715DF6
MWKNFLRAQELGQIGWWRLDTRNNILTWSDENYRIFGKPPGEPQNYQTFLDVVHPDDREYVHQSWIAALHGASYDIEHRLVVGGREKWVHEKASLEFDSSGDLLGAFGVTQDITDRKTVEKALEWSVRRNELLSKTGARLLQSGDVQHVVEDLCAEVMQFLDCQAFFNFLLDEETGRLRLNACAGIPAAAAREIEWLDFGVAMCGCVARDRRRAIVERISTTDDIRTELVASFGIEAYCCHPLMSQGRLLGTLSFGTKTRATFNDDEVEVMHAVSQLVSMAMQRLEMESALREADRRKDEFLATLAHELRNPLAPIRTGLMVMRRNPENAHRVQEMMERQVDHIVRLVDDLLEVSRIRSGKIELKVKRVDLTDVLRQAVETSQQFFDASRVALAVTAPDAPLIVQGDPVRLTQIVANLLNNAAKYTPAGGRAEIEAHRIGDEAVLTVSDNGLGIPIDMQPHVFDLFAQVDQTLGRAQGGLGIGLSLVRNLVELHGGAVEVESEGPGEGSRFTLRLPLAAEVPAAFDAEARPAAARLANRVLIVDDNKDAAESLALLLRAQGAQTRVAYSGDAGIEVARDFMPELVFLDLGMREINGYETARRIRAMPGCRETTLVALTGWGGWQTRERAKAAGFDLHMVKPASVEDIERALAFRVA